MLRWATAVPPPRRPSGRRRRRAKRAALAVLLLTVLAAASVATRVLLDRAPHPDRATLSPAPASKATATRGDPGRTDPGIHVQVSPRKDGTLDVVEQIRFLGAATGLQVALPATKGVVAGALPPATRITELQVTADGHRLPRQSESLATGGRVLLPNAPLSVELRYRLVGAATRSTPSTRGRALVLLPPIADDERLSRLPVVVVVEGKGVRGLVCPGLAPHDQLCGRSESAGWRTVFLSPRGTAVLAQLDLTGY
ncbi:hypothetical protein GCM10009845_23490 [Pedococcus bigeumensis]